MNAPLGLLASLSLTAALGIALGAFIAASLRALPAHPAFTPATRADGCLALLLLPPVLGLIGCVTVIAPGLAHLLGAAPDHCLSHLHHGHVCPLHSPLIAGGTFELAVLAGSGLLLGGCAAQGAWRLLLTQRAARQLARLAQLGEGGAPMFSHPCLLLPTGAPLAFTVGVFTPQTFLSTGLVQALSGRTLDAIVAHESAHRQRRDGLRQLLAAMAHPFHMPSSARALQQVMLRCTEEACDEQAARTTGSRHELAQALLCCSRLMVCNPVTSSCCAAAAPSDHQGVGSDLCDRVERLLQPTVASDGQGLEGLLLPSLSVTVVFATLALASHPRVHHAIETLLAVMTS